MPTLRIASGSGAARIGTVIVVLAVSAFGTFGLRQFRSFGVSAVSEFGSLRPSAVSAFGSHSRSSALTRAGFELSEVVPAIHPAELPALIQLTFAAQLLVEVAGGFVVHFRE